MNFWMCLTALLSKGYEVKFSNCNLLTDSISIEMSYGIHHTKRIVPKEMIFNSNVDSNSVMCEILKEIWREFDLFIKRSEKPFEKPLVTGIKWEEKDNALVGKGTLTEAGKDFFGKEN